jgi:hypothetical protein
MGRTPALKVRQDDERQTEYYSPDLLPLIQSLLATLANMEFAYEKECEKVSGCTDVILRARALARLKAEHSARREPYLHQLAVLQERVRRGMAVETAGS